MHFGVQMVEFHLVVCCMEITVNVMVSVQSSTSDSLCPVAIEVALHAQGASLPDAVPVAATTIAACETSAHSANLAVGTFTWVQGAYRLSVEATCESCIQDSHGEKNSVPGASMASQMALIYVNGTESNFCQPVVVRGSPKTGTTLLIRRIALIIVRICALDGFSCIGLALDDPHGIQVFKENTCLFLITSSKPHSGYGHSGLTAERGLFCELTHGPPACPLTITLYLQAR
jgi:hypothetical protein